MKLIYLAPIRFPEARSAHVQVAHTARELALRGIEVDMRFKSFAATDTAEAFGFYGLDAPPNLRAGKLSAKPDDKLNHWHGRSFQWGLYQLAFRQLFRAKEPTLFYVFGGRKALYTVPRLKRAVRPFGGRVVFETHDSQYRSMPDRLRHEREITDEEMIARETENIRRMERLALRRADGLVLVSERLKEQFAKDYGVDKPTAIAHASSTIQPLANDALDKKDLDLVFAGHFYPFNGVEVVIEALVHLPGVTLTLAGGASEEERVRVLGLAQRLGVGDRVDYKGFLPLPEVYDLLGRAKLAAVPLRRGIYYRVDEFCCPTKLSEAMASGACPVVSDLPSMRGLLTEGRNAAFFEPDNPESMARAVRDLLDDDEKRKRIATGALADSADFSFKNRADRIVGLLESLI